MAVPSSRPVSLTFQRVESEPSAVRVVLPSIGQQTGASYSQIGKGSLQQDPSLHIGWDTYQTDQTILHEMGHALGFIHELQQPASTVQWNVDAVNSYFGGEPNNWTKAEIKLNVLDKQASYNHTKFDPQSIMIYPYPSSLTTNGMSIPLPMKLSELDKELAAIVYPQVSKEGESCGGFAGLMCASNYYAYASDTVWTKLTCRQPQSVGFDQMGVCVRE